MKMPYGKYKDWDVRDVPRDYIEWLNDKAKTDAEALQRELDRRDAMEEANTSWVERIVKTGYRTLSQKHHPDVGGNSDEMREVNLAYEKIKSMCGL